MLVDTMIVTNVGLLKVCFDEQDLAEVKKIALEVGQQAWLDIKINLENGRVRRVVTRPNYILLKMCLGKGRLSN